MAGNPEGARTVYFPARLCWIFEVFEKPEEIANFLEAIPKWFGFLEATDKSEMFQDVNPKIVNQFLKIEEVLANHATTTEKGDY